MPDVAVSVLDVAGPLVAPLLGFVDLSFALCLVSLSPCPMPTHTQAVSLSPLV